MTDFLNYLINPIDDFTFFQQYFDRDHFHVSQRHENYFADIISIDEILEMVVQPGNTYPNIQLIRDGEMLPLNEYTTDQYIGIYQFEQVVKAKRLSQLFCDEKSSIRIFHAQRINHKIRRRCRQLETIFGCDVQANIYITPPDAQGFKIHFDTHPIFVAQLHGSKQWKIFDSAFPSPFHADYGTDKEFKHRTENANCVFETELRQGELLFIPRGVIHEVYSTSSPSVHIAFGVRQDTTYDFIKRVLENGKDSPAFRNLMPSPVQGSKEMGRFKQEVMQLLEQLVTDNLQNETPTSCTEDESLNRLKALLER